MPRICKDERKWKIQVILNHDECPYLTYPNSTHGCTHPLRTKVNPDAECIMDKCPLLDRVIDADADNNAIDQR